MLRNWDFNIGIYKGGRPLARPRTQTPTSPQTALWWLNNNADIWGEWVTDDAADGIEAALSAGEEAEGWPSE